jgi:phenylpyruvate tautomerase PptA (4-oxalocrotonate tautomerase family)
MIKMIGINVLSKATKNQNKLDVAKAISKLNSRTLKKKI